MGKPAVHLVAVIWPLMKSREAWEGRRKLGRTVCKTDSFFVTYQTPMPLRIITDEMKVSFIYMSSKIAKT